MSTRAYIRYVQEQPNRDGEHVTRRAAGTIASDGTPWVVATTIEKLGTSEPFDTPTGYVAAHTLPGDTHTLDDVDRHLMDPSVTPPWDVEWSYEVVTDGEYLTGWQVRVSEGRPPTDGDWAVEGPAELILPALRELRTGGTRHGFRALMAARDDPETSLFAWASGGDGA